MRGNDVTLGLEAMRGPGRGWRVGEGIATCVAEIEDGMQKWRM